MPEKGNYKKDLLEHLFTFATDQRKERFLSIVRDRTRYVTIVLEDLFQSHNTSAVLRSCDCFGVQDVHIIENINEYTLNPDIALGSSKWLSVMRYNQREFNTQDCISRLKQQGYRIVATTPHTNDTTVRDLDLQKGPIALMFGTELDGLSPEAMDAADEYVKIPMYGFTESFNISVSAALVLYEVTGRLRSSDCPWRLSEEEELDILLDWARTTVRSAESLEAEFLKGYPANG